jgi:spore coat polysaccharide biosynthesis protein SpsF (cytidylyltransferase family)
MATITLNRESSTYDKQIASYRMRVTVTSADGINPKVFVNQRLRDAQKQTFDDVFVAVATPTQLEDFAPDAPNEGTSFFRTSTIDVISRNADYLENVFDDILWNVQKLVTDIDALQTLTANGTYVIDAEGITQ